MKLSMACFVATALAVVLLGPAPPARAARDVTPPTLLAFGVDTPSVDVTTGPGQVAVHAAVADDLSGVESVYVAAYSSTGQLSSNFLTPGDGSSYTGTIWIPHYTEPGTWYVDSVSLSDVAGNVTTLDAEQLRAAGFPTTFEVTRTPDTQPPTITAFSIDPTLVVVTADSAFVTVHATIEDAFSGVEWAYVVARSPSGAQQVGGTFGGAGVDEYQLALLIPRGAETGTWRIEHVYVRDNASNFADVTNAQLRTAGFATEFSVTTPPDTEPPVITAGDFSTNATTAEGAEVFYQVQIADAMDPYATFSCVPAPGSFFPIGDTPVECTATDSSGNTSTASFTVHVRGALEQFDRLEQLIASYALDRLGMSLEAKVETAVDLFDAGRPNEAANVLGALAAEVRAQAGNELTSDQAATLEAAAVQLQQLLAT